MKHSFVSRYFFPNSSKRKHHTLLDNVLLSSPGFGDSYALSLDITDHLLIISGFNINNSVNNVLSLLNMKRTYCETT